MNSGDGPGRVTLRGLRRSRPDHARGEDYEVLYWSQEFGCTPDELKATVRKVGVTVKDVEIELRRSK